MENEVSENGFNVEVCGSDVEGEWSEKIGNKKGENGGVELELSRGLGECLFNKEDL
ncbi:poly-gamma-glutamate hydrolase family protein [Staphylococcus saprophyticus]|uniref:poly-gamma-glutamate hydrolase family protein n=1 Tax=Staphylococcus saprophyticus TaxID=29385 RepID=UPI001CDA3124|nr:poly-gamma-glutamate hydrolase family protein [Staphylococcus saprophyticus]